MGGKKEKEVRKKILETYPAMKDFLDDLWPKKDAKVIEKRLKG